MRTPSFYDGQFVSAASENAAFANVASGISDALSALFTPGVEGTENATFTLSGLTITCELSGVSVLFENGVLSLPLGTVDGSTSSTYTVDLSSNVPASGTVTVYIVAIPVSIGSSPSIITGPPPGNPDYDPTFSPYSAYLLYRDSFAVAATTTAPTGNVVEIGRVSVAQGSTSLGSLDLTEAARIGVADVTEWSSSQIVNARSLTDKLGDYYTSEQVDEKFVSQYPSTLGSITSATINPDSKSPTFLSSAGVWYECQPYGDYALVESISQFLGAGGSTTLTVPKWASRIEYFLTGGGGGGADCQSSGANLTSTNASGGGGGAGATAIGTISVTAGGSVIVAIGSGGGPESDGGDSTLTYNGQVYAVAGGGGGAKFSNTALSAGGSAGSATASGGTPVPGSNGSDGQNGSFIFAGNGGASFWGSGGRAGSAGGISGSPFGSGGGGAYDSTFTGVFYHGGYGASGFLLYRWLP